MPIEKLAIEFPELRVHLAHLRKNHTRMHGAPPPPLRTCIPPPPPPRKRRVKKIRVTLRLSPEVLEEFKASGQGWQTRMDEALLKMVLEKEVKLDSVFLGEGNNMVQLP